MVCLIRSAYSPPPCLCCPSRWRCSRCPPFVAHSGAMEEGACAPVGSKENSSSSSSSSSSRISSN
eukprot:6154317-Pyramimonas_sp.AAC.1